MSMRALGIMAAAVLLVGCAAGRGAGRAPSAEALVAEVQAGQARAAARADALAAEVRAEPRNAAWAGRKEAALWAAAGRGGGLRSVECRSALCEVAVAGPIEEPGTLAWLARSEPCGFTVASGPGAGGPGVPGTARVFVDCRQGRQVSGPG